MAILDGQHQGYAETGGSDKSGRDDRVLLAEMDHLVSIAPPLGEGSGGGPVVISQIGQLIAAINAGDDVTNFDVSGLTELIGIGGIHQNTFNQDISGWDVSNITDMTNMFAENHAFSYDLSGWDVSSVTDCAYFGYDSGLTCSIMPNLPTSCTGCI
jgi:surface protein